MESEVKITTETHFQVQTKRTEDPLSWPRMVAEVVVSDVRKDTERETLDMREGIWLKIPATTTYLSHDEAVDLRDTLTEAILYRRKLIGR